MRQGALAVALSFFILGAAASGPLARAQQSASASQQNVPSAPTPAGLKALTSQVTPGIGTTAEPPINTPAPSQAPPAASGPLPATPSSSYQSAPETSGSREGTSAYLIRVPVNFVQIPVTVRNKHHQLVPGLTWRQFRVYEDGVRQRIAFFSSDPAPMSVAFVIDQSLPADIERKINESLGAVAGAFTPDDSMAVFTYDTSPTMVTTFTGVRGPRLVAALQQAKRPGRRNGVPMVDGPFATGPQINGQLVDPNLATLPGQPQAYLSLPKQLHPLNDAIFAAAKALAHQPLGRRRIIYVISDGRNSGSKISQKEVLRFLLTNNISVYGTLVGNAALWGVGYLDKMHLPLLPPSNVMPRYAVMTGGTLEAALTENGIQRTFGAIAASLRGEYTLGYYSHASTLSGTRHSITVDVTVPGLDVTAKQYYYPSMASIER